MHHLPHFYHGGEVLETFPPLVSMDRWENQLESFGTTFLRGGKKPMACGRFSLEPSIDKCDTAKKMMPRLSPGSLADTCGMVMTGDYWRWVPNQGIHLSISQPINLSIDPSIDQAINQSCNLSFDRSMDLSIDGSSDLPIYRSINQSIIDLSIDQSTNQPINQSINQPTNQPINQSINL